MPYAAHHRPCYIHGNGDSILVLEFSPNFLLVRSQFRQIHKLVFSVCWDQGQGVDFCPEFCPPPPRLRSGIRTTSSSCFIFLNLLISSTFYDFEHFNKFFYSGAALTLNRTHEKRLPNNTCFEHTIKFLELLWDRDQDWYIAFTRLTFPCTRLHQTLKRQGNLK